MVVHFHHYGLFTGNKLWKIKFLRSQYVLDTIQDFLCNLGIKPHMHLVEIGIFSLNHVIVRPTRIIKDLGKAST